MKQFHIQKYTKSDIQLWNAFVSSSKNGTFLFQRDFMEYHQNKFDDCSLLIFDENQQLRALVPAHIKGNTLFSHQGLTYGGLIVNSELRTDDYIRIFRELLDFLNLQGIEYLQIKSIPSFYSTIASDELEYLSFVLSAERYRTDFCSTIFLKQGVTFSKSTIRNIKNAGKLPLEIGEVTNLQEFWNDILSPNLQEKYQTQPVHSYEEIAYLKSKFNDNIIFYELRLEGKLVAGTVLFIDKKTVHVQYLSALESVKNLRVLYYFFGHIIVKYKDLAFDYFDFGISNENNGENINLGLLNWKESFGARAIVQNFYRFKTCNTKKLDSIFR